jgi:hypothetical protein
MVLRAAVVKSFLSQVVQVPWLMMSPIHVIKALCISILCSSHKNILVKQARLFSYMAVVLPTEFSSTAAL